MNLQNAYNRVYTQKVLSQCYLLSVITSVCSFLYLPTGVCLTQQRHSSSPSSTQSAPFQVLSQYFLQSNPSPLYCDDLITKPCLFRLVGVKSCPPPFRAHLAMSGHILLCQILPVTQPHLCYHVVCRGQGCCRSANHPALHRVGSQQKITLLHMSIVPWLGNSAPGFESKGQGSSVFTYPTLV